MNDASELDTDELAIRFEPGNTGTVVVSFTGIGFGMGGIQKEEFVKTLGSPENKNASIYVIDKTRSWYNRTHLQILNHLHPVLKNFDRVVTLGNSMGGFGALFFGALLPRCQRAISFVPQYSVDSSCSDPRWMQWRSLIKAWPVANCLVNTSRNTPAVVIFGEDELHDRWHRSEIQRHLTAPHELITLRGVGHEVAVAIKRKGALSRLINQAIDGETGEALRGVLLSAGFSLVERSQ